MSKHTLGPWKVRTSARERSKQLTISQSRADDLPIATVHLGAGTPANQQANARLIAAAPELLEALENLLRPIENGWKVDDMRDRIEDAKSAISKATE